jgi:circadian clock protein KaiB
MCERYLAGRYELKVIDLYQRPGLAAEKGIIATPTLVREAPLPRRWLIGGLSDSNCVLRALGVAA